MLILIVLKGLVTRNKLGTSLGTRNMTSKYTSEQIHDNIRSSQHSRCVKNSFIQVYNIDRRKLQPVTYPDLECSTNRIE